MNTTDVYQNAISHFHVGEIVKDLEFRGLLSPKLEDSIGKKCQKSTRGRDKEPKPFKSGFKINTIKGVTTNPHTGKPAYTFEEDDSCVNCENVIIKN